MNERVRVASMRVYEARERLIGQVWDCGGTRRCCALSLSMPTAVALTLGPFELMLVWRQF